MSNISKILWVLILVSGLGISVGQAQSKLNFLGKDFGATAPCEGNNYTISTTEGGYLIVIINAPESGTTDVNDDFYTKDCVTCPIVQLTDSEGTEYHAASGTLSHEGNRVRFKVLLIKTTDPNAKIELSGDVVCEG
jgi:hypothetical protein